MTFHVGQKVVCIIDSVGGLSRPRGGAPWPPEIYDGLVLTVRDVDTRFIALCGVCGLRFAEFRYPSPRGGEYTFPADHFRPVTERKTDISIFKRLLQPNSKIIERV